jgi:uncharacterized protein (TIGR04255 family)
MSRTQSSLPDFAAPPVTEVALSVQFDPLTVLRTPHLGLLWQDFRDRFPKTEEHSPLPPVIEKFGLIGLAPIGVRFEATPPVPRCWFLNEAGTKLIQVQQDRFVHNWRKIGQGDEYPRYEQIRQTFETELGIFCQFLAREQLGELAPNQCEVTYVNQILSGRGWEKHGQLGEVVTMWTSHHSDEFLSEPEDVHLAVRYVIPDSTGNPLGRLLVNVEPAYRVSDGTPIFVLQLTARGKPDGEGVEGVLKFFDRGREWIVRGFASMTSPLIHKIWERRDAQ